MRKIEEFADERQKASCIHCTRALSRLKTSDDHVPSKSLLTKPHPHHLPVVTICNECNVGFSLDEQYFVTFLSCVLSGSTVPESQVNASAARALAGSDALRLELERSRSDYVTMAGESRTTWKPAMRRVERIVLKNARGHAYFEFGEPLFMIPPNHIEIVPLECMAASARLEFESSDDLKNRAAWPEVGSRMMTCLLTKEDMSGPWVIVQDGIYRYSVQQTDSLRIRSVIWEYLATDVTWLAR